MSTGPASCKNWSAAGRLIGNHTDSHYALLEKATPEAFEQDILQNDGLLHRLAGLGRWFCFPALQELDLGSRKETGRFENRLRYPGEDDVYEKTVLDELGLWLLAFVAGALTDSRRC